VQGFEMTGQGLDHYQKLDVDKQDNDDALRAVYDEWAKEYDHDNDATLGTISQPKTVEILSAVLEKHAKILDAGCGTGLVGAELAKRGYAAFDGVDLSAEMLRYAKTRGYTKLFQYSLNDPLPISDGAYDAIISAGLFTHGHVKTHAIRELIRITKSGGYLCFTINEGVYRSQAFDKEIQSITDDKLWDIEKLEKEAYMTKEQVQAYYCLAQVR
jgi:ubiquinone/menaquinone biosynthesis C-methylase UbiE